MLFYCADTLLVDLGGKRKLTQILLYLLAFNVHKDTLKHGALEHCSVGQHLVCILRVDGEGTDMCLVKAGIASATDNSTSPNKNTNGF